MPTHFPSISTNDADVFVLYDFFFLSFMQSLFCIQNHFKVGILFLMTIKNCIEQNKKNHSIGFIIVAACVMTFEARDSAAKVVPARFKLSTTTRANAPRINSARRTTGNTFFFSLAVFNHICGKWKFCCFCIALPVFHRMLIVCLPKCYLFVSVLNSQFATTIYCFLQFIFRPTHSSGYVIDTCRWIANGSLGQSIGCV